MSSIKQCYEKNGYYIARNLFSDSLCNMLNLHIKSQVLSQFVLEKTTEPGSGTAMMDTTLCVHQPHAVSDEILKIMKHENVKSYLAGLIGQCVKGVQSMLFIKGPGLQGQAWHQDEYYIPTRDRSLCGVWLALDDAIIENGCLWVIKGSHQKGYLYPMKDHKEPENFDRSKCAFGFSEASEIPVQLKRGDALFFNGYLLHRSKKNVSKNLFRRALVFHYMNGNSLLPWGAECFKNAESSGYADNRRVIQILGEDPYEWKGTIDDWDPHLRDINT